MSSEIIVLTHGLWMPSWMLGLLRRRLHGLGLPCFCFSYPTVQRDLTANSQALANYCASFSASKIHLVGHSLGGVVILKMLQEQRYSVPGRVVLLGAPIAGNSAARQLSHRPLFNKILGLCVQQLINEAPMPIPPGHEVGIIAGRKSLGLGRLLVSLAQPNDGVVTTEEARSNMAQDFIVLNVSHSGMLFSSQVAEQTLYFLKYGHFNAS